MLVALFASAPAEISRPTTTSWPTCAATYSGVAPSSVLAKGLARGAQYQPTGAAAGAHTVPMARASCAYSNARCSSSARCRGGWGGSRRAPAASSQASRRASCSEIEDVLS